MDGTNTNQDRHTEEMEALRLELDEARKHLEKSRQENILLERQLNERKMELWAKKQ